VILAPVAWWNILDNSGIGSYVKLYDTLSGEKREFEPWDGRTVRMYVCGVTPYDVGHIGHAMTYLTFDVLNRYCQYLGWRVKYVQNVTDIDDDIIRKSKEAGDEWDKLGDRYTRHLVEDLSALNVLWPSVFPRASEEVDTIIEINSKLIEDGFAYEMEGNVYFRTKADKDYGALSKYGYDEMVTLSRERGADPDDPHKEDPLDFILWQAWQPGEPFWESPWGRGRPGWHIECTAMSMRYLGETIDIHGGGSDLIYPHHECEISQAQHFSGKQPFTRFWMHIGMVGYHGDKMSKSLGNLVLARDVLRHHTPDALRLYLHSNNYREEWEYRDTGPAEFEGVASLLREANHVTSGAGAELDASAYEPRFRAALDDDLDTATAIEVLREMATEIIERAARKENVAAAQQSLRDLAGILGMQGTR
jgi:L-cysteine:1D-myo-inositol 2-amino-2-deoxy-alpha-D-glucopyranoside ligase